MLLSRLGFRANVVWGTVFLLRALDPPTPARSRYVPALGGLLFGLGLHSYTAYWPAPAVVAVPMIGYALRGEGLRQVRTPGLAAADQKVAFDIYPNDGGFQEIAFRSGALPAEVSVGGMHG